MRFLKTSPNWLWTLGVLSFAVILALIVRAIVFSILRKVSRRKGTILESFVRHSTKPSWLIFPFVALLIALPDVPISPFIQKTIEHAVGLGLIAAVAWLVILFSAIFTDVVFYRYRTDVADNLRARKVQTQFKVLHRVFVTIVLLIALGVMLMTFPAIDKIGTSLLASAGLAGLVVGMAMRPTLSSLVAGIQIALTQPIRIEDAVVVEGEWGWIEEIAATYVVVRIWDLRRLVLPLSYFIEHPFQNWTRKTADLLGSVMLWVDYTVPVEEVRQELRRIAQSTDKWKGEVCVLDVTDANEHAIQLRALVDARDSGQAWDLRCYVREKLIEFLQQSYPRCLPRLRAEVTQSPTQPVPAQDNGSTGRPLLSGKK